MYQVTVFTAVAAPAVTKFESKAAAVAFADLTGGEGAYAEVTDERDGTFNDSVSCYYSRGACANSRYK